MKLRKFVSLLLLFLSMMIWTACESNMNVSTKNLSQSWKTYRNSWFSLEYPQTWTVHEESTGLTQKRGGIYFVNSTRDIGIQVHYIYNAQNSIPAKTFIQASLKSAGHVLKDSKLLDIPATITLNGMQWDQGGISGTNSQTQIIETYELAGINYPLNASNTRFVSISFEAFGVSFDKEIKNYFKHVTQTFKFIT